MSGLKICLNTQTPLIRFKLQYSELLEKYGDLPDPVPLEMLAEDEDYEIAPGGVPKMVYPLMKEFIKSKLAEKVHWVSLNPIGPERIIADDILIHNISLVPHELSAYTHLKERIWEEIHGLEKHQIGPKEFGAYAKYNWLCAEKMFELLPIDVFYIHDFQQLQIGNMLGLAAPVVLRWHIPFQLDTVTKYTRNFIVKCVEAFDAIIVSCKRDLEGLIRAGYRGSAYQIYPYVDPRKWSYPSENEVNEFCARFGITSGEKIILVVARMDRIKGHDVVINALTNVLKTIPNTKLVFVGNGSFSSSHRGGLGHPKGMIWREHLEKIAVELNIRKNIIFTGYLPDRLVRAAYKRCDVAVLPSVKEGFGLVVVEAWLYKKPVVVSSGAGVSELVINGTNGYIFPSGKAVELAKKIKCLLSNSEDALKMGERGAETARRCYIKEGVKSVVSVMKGAVKEYGSK